MKKYPEYIDSGIEWLGEIPASWTLKPLKYISQFIVSNVDKKTYEDEIIVRLCNYSDVYNNDEISDDLNFMQGSVKASEFKKFKLQEGDVIITKDSETPYDIAIPAYVPVNYEDLVCGYHLAIIRSNGSMVGKYVYYLFRSYRFNQQFTVSARGITRFGLSQSSIANAIIGIPSTFEQSTIASFLDQKTQQIDDLIAKKQRLIELLKEERTAVINQAVTRGLDPTVPMKDSGIEWLGEVPEHWEVVKLKYLSKIRYGLGQPPKTKEGGLPIIRATNIQRGEIVENDLLLVDPDDLPYEKNPILKEGEIIVVRSGAYTADSAIVPKKYAGSVTGYDLVLSCFSIESIFLSFILLSGYVLDKQLFPLSIRAAQPHLNAEELGSILICMPPKYEQIEISNQLLSEKERINNLIDISNKELELLKEYKTSLINEAITGKIDVRDYQEFS